MGAEAVSVHGICVSVSAPRHVLHQAPISSGSGTCRANHRAADITSTPCLAGVCCSACWPCSTLSVYQLVKGATLLQRVARSVRNMAASGFRTRFVLPGTINWFPGHMAKAARDMRSKLRHMDLVVEVRDARVSVQIAHRGMRLRAVHAFPATHARLTVRLRARFRCPAAIQCWKSLRKARSD